MQEIWVQSLSQEDPLEEEMATHSSILTWRIPRTEEPGGLQSVGSQSRIWLSEHTHAQQMLVSWSSKAGTDLTLESLSIHHWSLAGVKKKRILPAQNEGDGGHGKKGSHQPHLSHPSFKLLLQPLALNLWVETHRLQRVASENPASWKRTIDFSRQCNSKEKKKVFLNYAFQLGQENNSCHIFG